MGYFNVLYTACDWSIIVVSVVLANQDAPLLYVTQFSAELILKEIPAQRLSFIRRDGDTKGGLSRLVQGRSL